MLRSFLPFIQVSSSVGMFLMMLLLIWGCFLALWRCFWNGTIQFDDFDRGGAESLLLL